MDAESAAAAFGEDGEIAASLSGLNNAEGVFLSGDGQVGSIVASDLEEDAAVGAAFVGLPVEWRKRGPKPRQVATFLESRTEMRMDWRAASFSAFIGMYPR